MDLKKLLNLNNVLKMVGLVEALKGLKGKSKTEQTTDGIQIVESVLGLDVVDEDAIRDLIRDTEAWATEGERLAREGERLLKSVREAVGRVAR